MQGQGAILALFEARRSDLVRYATRFVGDRAQAEDVVQEAWIRYGTAERTPDDPIRYLYRIVRNLAVDGRRALVREGRYVLRNAEKTETVAEDAPSPEVAVAAKDELRLLELAMAELPERTRVALHMHRVGGHKLKEIADHLGISVGLAHALVVDGLEHCRARLYGR